MKALETYERWEPIPSAPVHLLEIRTLIEELLRRSLHFHNAEVRLMPVGSRGFNPHGPDIWCITVCIETRDAGEVDKFWMHRGKEIWGRIGARIVCEERAYTFVVPGAQAVETTKERAVAELLGFFQIRIPQPLIPKHR